MDIANLVIRVTNEGLDRATRELRRLQDNAAGAQSANEKFGKSIADLNKYALVGMGALAATIGGSIKTAISFESAMAEVNKTVDFAASNGLKNLQSGFEELTKTIPLTFEELAELGAVGGQLGVAEQDLLGFTETVAKMGIAFDISAAEAGDSMAKIAGVFQIPISEIGGLGDAINAVSNSMAATAPDIIDFMRRIGGSAAALKISAENATALGGAMVALGMQPEVAGTAFNSLATTLAKFDQLGTRQMSGFAKLGLDTKEFSELVKTDGVGAIRQVLAAAKELGGTDALGALNDAFGEAGIKISTMAEGISTVDAALETVKDTAGSMEAEFEKMSDTTANKMTIVGNNMRLVAAGIGEAFLPAVNDLLASLVPVIENITVWAKANPELIVTIAKVTAGVLGAVIAMAAISGAIGVVISTFQGLSAIFGVAKIAIMALSGPIGLTVIALGILVAAGALVYQNWDLIKAKATEIWGAITGYIGNKINEIKGYFSNNFPAMTAIVSGALQIMSSVVSGGFALIKNTVSTVLAVIKAVISGDFKAIPGIIGNGLKAAASVVSSMMSNILNIIINTGKRLYNIGKDLVQGLVNGIKSGASGVATAIGDMASGAIAKAKGVLQINSPSKVFTKIGLKGIAGGTVKGIDKGAKAVKTAAQRMAEGAIDAVKSGIAGLQKEIALFGNDSSLASFDYDRNAGIFKGVPDSLLEQNRNLIIQKQTLIDLDKQQTESARGLAKAREAIQARFAQLDKDKASSKNALDGVMGEIANETPLGKIQADYEQRMEIVRSFEQLHTDETQRAADARLAIEQSYMNAKRDLMLGQGEALFGDLAGMAKAFGGEQSGIYRALFAVEKGFAIAQSAIAIQQSVAKAMALGFPQNIPVIGQAISQGASIVSNIKSIAPKGFKQGGYTGNMGASQVAGVVHGQEYVFDAQSTKRIGVDNLNAMRSGKASSSGETKVIVNNYSNEKANVQTTPDGDTIVTIGKMVNQMVDGKLSQWERNAKRQGHALYGMR